jgi:hypothetical protein
MFAKFRADKLKVLVIFSAVNLSKKMRAIVNKYNGIKLTYKVNKILSSDKLIII